jgi:hypothetical protein
LHPSDFPRLGAWVRRLKCPTVIVLEGGDAASELGTHAANVDEAFKQG